MIVHTVKLLLSEAKANKFYDFITNPSDEKYRQWFPGEHLSFRRIHTGANSPLGDTIFFDEFLCSRRRIKFRAIVTVAKEPNQIVWQMTKCGIRLPGWLDMEFIDTDTGLALTHELRVGWRGWAGRLTDPLIRLYITKGFQDDLEKHCREEWPRLAELLKD